MQIITVDLDEYAFSDVQDLSFSSSESILGHDVVVFDLARASLHYQDFYGEQHNGLPFLREKGEDFRRTIERRRTEVCALLEGGAVVIALTPPETTVYVKARDQSKAVKGRVLVDPVSALSVLPIDLKSESAGGQAVTPISPAFRSFFDANGEKLRYDGILTLIPPNCSILAKVRGTSAPVAIHSYAGKGHIIILPRPGVRPRYDPEGGLINDPSRKYFTALPQLITALTKSDIVQTPAWIDRYVVPGERDAINHINASIAALAQAQEDFEKSKASLTDLQRIKELLYADGATLEKAVERALEELGFSIEPRAEENRVDIIAKADKKVLAVEVKGLLKSGTEANATELESG